MIERLGWQVTACSDAKQALDAAVENGYQVVVSDIELPGRDGVELMRELRTRGVDAPFVLVSGVMDPIGPVEGIADGACCFMTKPLCLDILAAAVAKATKRACARSSDRLT
jgi:FixJ family two-component response regulator